MGIRDWFRGARPADDREVREEIVFHLDRATQENIARGMGPEEARADALRRFGDLEQVRRDCLSARGRRLPPVVAWSAVAALAAASFVGGYAVRSGGGSPTAVLAQPTLLGAGWPTTRLLSTNPVEVATRRYLPNFADLLVKNRIDVPNHRDYGLISGLRTADPASPFSAWRWKDGVPEVKLAGEGWYDGGPWYELVSAAGIPAATLREENRKAQGLPVGVYMDANPHLMILGNRKCKGPTVEIVLRSLADGGEVTVACAGGWVKVSRVPQSKWPKVEPK